MPSDRDSLPRQFVVHVEPTNPVYGLPTAITYDSEYMAAAAAEGLRHTSTYARVWVETVGGLEPAAIDPADFVALGRALADLYSQALNGVVCDPSQEEVNRHNCKTCHDAWAQAKAVLDRYDPKWGNGYRRGPSFQPGGLAHAL